jgi:hypothetical protein
MCDILVSQAFALTNATCYRYAAGGLCMGIVANKLWACGWAPGGRRGRLSVGADDHFAHEVEGDLAMAWKTIFQPLLFGVIGEGGGVQVVNSVFETQSLQAAPGGFNNPWT